jgi:hypothetical protein
MYSSFECSILIRASWKADARPDAIDIDTLMLDPEAVPTFTRSRKIVDPEVVVLLTALAVTVSSCMVHLW